MVGRLFLIRVESVVMSESSSQPNGSGDMVECSICKNMFKRRGLKRHITVSHGRLENGSQGQAGVSVCPVPLSTSATSGPGVLVPVSEGNLDWNAFGALLNKARTSIRVIRVIPKCARNRVAEELTWVLKEVVDKADSKAWQRLLSFAYIVLRLPCQRTRKKASTFILQNLRTWRSSSIADVFLEHRVPVFLGGRVQEDRAVARMVSTKLGEGDVKSAVRILLSDESFCENNEDTLSLLRDKHPESPPDLEYATLDPRTDWMPISAEEVNDALKSFPLASGSSFDGLRPRHIRDLCSLAVSPALVDAIRAFCEVAVNGVLPDFILPFFYGASLSAFVKKTGGIRPIACGLTWRRLVSKILVRASKGHLASVLLPEQVGCGVRGGSEAAIHSLRSFVESSSTMKVLVKIDFANAFNVIRRDHMLKMVAEHWPEALRSLHQAYRTPSNVYFGGDAIISACGVQQGDPCGPATFCLSILPLTKSLKSELNIWYLDDGVIGGDCESVIEDIQAIKVYCQRSGLSLNSSKCEVCVVGGFLDEQRIAVDRVKEALTNVRVTDIGDLEHLGVPIMNTKVTSAIIEKTGVLRVLLKRLSLLDSQTALFLLRVSLSSPRVVHLLRASRAFESIDALGSFDDMIRGSLESLLNLPLDNTAYVQACLPIRMGGLGIAKVNDIAGIAYDSSILEAEELVMTMISEPARDYFGQAVEVARARLDEITGESGLSKNIQKKASHIIFERTRDRIINEASNNSERARLLAVQDKMSGKFLEAVPSPQLGTTIDDISFRVVVGLRLGCKICQPHTCASCKRVTVDELGRHGLSCVACQGRHPRHSELIDVVSRSMRAARIPSIKEPVGLMADDNKRPDGLTLIPWENGKSLVYDVTTSCTLAHSHVEHCSAKAGAAANVAERQKVAKYRELSTRFIVMPVAFETMGSIGDKTRDFIDDLGSRIAMETGDMRSAHFLKQRLSIAVQRGNAASFLGSLLRSQDVS